MNYHHSRRILTLDESSRKRKDRDTFYSSPRPSNPLTPVSNANLTTSFAKPDPKKKGQMPNSVLAGYLAFEYLTKGTLLGQKFDPARPRAAAAAPVNALADPKKRKSSPEEVKLNPKPQNQNYVEIASLLRSDGTHIPGIVNPTQLAQWIQM
ncbi:hypothetical protein R3W88_025584 [Solanum pinnatisectum]|uniref:Embryo sac development arrest 6 n=1 Tax=Solanum pinnatisectum TaxID=50273 RepID=A0AAV9M3L3_9SOLN|nr:hypothetical protein R3W88_025584 [Solanum pinnatisectum]